MTLNEALLWLTAQGLPNAQKALEEAARRGVIATLGGSEGDDVPVLNLSEDSDLIDRGLTYMHRDDPEFHRDDLMDWGRSLTGRGSPENSSSKGKPGKKMELDWDTFWHTVVMEVEENGRGASQAEFIRRLYDRYPTTSRPPGSTVMQEKVSALFNALGWSTR
jgi:hypothetical protein